MISFLCVLATVTLNGAFQGQGLQVVHVARVHAQPPQRHGAQFVGCVFGRVLDDTVSGLDVVKQKVTVRVDDLIAQGVRYGKRSAIDNCSRGSGNDGADMTTGAANILEDLLSCLCCGRGSQDRVARWCFGAAHELREVIDIRQTDIVWNVFRVGRDLANRGHVLGPQAIGHSHFIKVRVTDKRKQATVLIFPAKAADARLSRRFQNRNLDCFPVDSAVADLYLVLSDGLQGAVVDGFDKAVSQGIESCTQGANVFTIRYVLLRLWDQRTVVNNRSICNNVGPVVDRNGRANKIAVGVFRAGAYFCKLTGPAANRVLVT